MTLQIDHVSIAVNDISQSQGFYDAVMPILGALKVGQSDTALRYGTRNSAIACEHSYLTVLEDSSFHLNSACHWCFQVQSREQVNSFYSQGVANGGTDKGQPGLRTDYHEHYYAAFVQDPAGNTIEAVCHLPKSE